MFRQNKTVIDMNEKRNIEINGKEIGKNTSYRMNAVAVGLMFIIATVTAILTMVNLGSILEPSGLLDTLPANETKIIVSVILELVLPGTL